jgi:hypothetical protein
VTASLCCLVALILGCVLGTQTGEYDINNLHACMAVSISDIPHERLPPPCAMPQRRTILNHANYCTSKHLLYAERSFWMVRCAFNCNQTFLVHSNELWGIPPMDKTLLNLKDSENKPSKVYYSLIFSAAAVLPLAGACLCMCVLITSTFPSTAMTQSAWPGSQMHNR